MPAIEPMMMPTTTATAIAARPTARVPADAHGVWLAGGVGPGPDPIPGTRQIRAVMIAPPTPAGIDSATNVTAGISALRTTCRVMTARSAIPFARAVVT